MSNAVTIKENPRQAVALYRTATTHTDVFNDIPAGCGQVLGFLGQAEISPVGAPFTIFHQVPDGDTPGDIAIGMPIGATVKTDSDATVSTTEMAADVTASVVHKGSYENLAESYGIVAAWIHEHGHSLAGPTREVYLNSPADVEEADLLTEIVFPINPDTNDGSV